MYFLTIQATAKPGTQQAQEAGGAYINCWLNLDSQVEAESFARNYIGQSGWVPGEKLEERWVEAPDYAGEADLLPYYREAEKEGTCFVYHTWPVGADDYKADDRNG